MRAVIVRRQSVLDIAIAPVLRFALFLFKNMTPDRDGERCIIGDILATHNRLFKIAACCPHLSTYRTFFRALFGEIARELFIVVLPDILKFYNVAIYPKAAYGLYIVAGGVYDKMMMQATAAVLVFGGVDIFERLPTGFSMLPQMP